jgi:hypothetical protein
MRAHMYTETEIVGLKIALDRLQCSVDNVASSRDVVDNTHDGDVSAEDTSASWN